MIYVNSIPIAVKSVSGIHSVNCTGLSDYHGQSQKCRAINKIINERLERLEHSMTSDITTRPIQASNTHQILKLYIEVYKNKLEESQNTILSLRRQNKRLKRCTEFDIDSPAGNVIYEAMKGTDNWDMNSFQVHYLKKILRICKKRNRMLIDMQMTADFYPFFNLRKKVMEILYKNLGFASNKTLKKYTPTWKYGYEPIDDLMTIIPSELQNCPVMVKWDEVDPIKGIDVLKRWQVVRIE